MASIPFIRINNFAAYGLNRKRNFLKAPDCECGGDEKLELSDVDAVRDFCLDVLADLNCDNSAIFCVFKDGRYMGVMKQPDDDGAVYMHVKPTRVPDMFSALDAEFRLCCYGMITEVENGLWHIEE